MTRLVRIRHKPLPEGVQAFAWPLPSGNVIVYVDPSLDRRERARAVRAVLGKTQVNRAVAIAAVVPAAIAPELRKHSQAIGAGAAVCALAATIGIAAVFSNPAHRHHRQHIAHGPLLVPPLYGQPQPPSPSAPHKRHKRHKPHPGNGASGVPSVAPTSGQAPSSHSPVLTAAKSRTRPVSPSAGRSGAARAAKPAKSAPASSTSPTSTCLVSASVSAARVVSVRVCGG